jgi:carbon-monoxide dehydrogenase iron sulfur subunit
MDVKNKGIIVDIEKCLGCKSCEIACAVAHSKSKVLQEAVQELPRPQRRVTVQTAGEFAVPLQCRHCEDAPCIEVCPTAAIHRKEANGPVLIDQDRCIGCKYCLVVCPFGVIEASHDGKVMVKCDLCFERAQAGQEPACVEACPTKALRLGSEKDLSAGKRRRVARDLVSSTQKNKQKSKEGTQ